MSELRELVIKVGALTALKEWVSKVEQCQKSLDHGKPSVLFTFDDPNFKKSSIEIPLTEELEPDIQRLLQASKIYYQSEILHVTEKIKKMAKEL